MTKFPEAEDETGMRDAERAEDDGDIGNDDLRNDISDEDAIVVDRILNG